MPSTWPGVEPATLGIEGQRYTNSPTSEYDYDIFQYNGLKRMEAAAYVPVRKHSYGRLRINSCTDYFRCGFSVPTQRQDVMSLSIWREHSNEFNEFSAFDVQYRDRKSAVCPCISLIIIIIIIIIILVVIVIVIVIVIVNIKD
ncbi:hypothetical protein ANN_19411 [Periplaneta americana]|uniref:Uncharacterized protein n=1 Tax=Periplaneta americana TaxID=6978 RepID=A0ABQ8SAG6_PERAM|nr:hypothetical protein ANN_19411 [Periplaneta americana]